MNIYDINFKQGSTNPATKTNKSAKNERQALSETLKSPTKIDINTQTDSYKQNKAEPKTTEQLLNPKEVWQGVQDKQNGDFKLTNVLKSQGTNINELSQLKKGTVSDLRISKLNKQITQEINNYILAPLKTVKNPENLTPATEKQVVSQVYERINEVFDNTARSMPAPADSESPLANLRYDLLTSTSEKGLSIIKDELSSLPSFKGQKDKTAVLANKFSYVFNMAADDVSYGGADIKKDIIEGNPDKAYLKAMRPEELKTKPFNTFVKIAGEQKLAPRAKQTLAKIYPNTDLSQYENIKYTDDASMTSYLGFNINTPAGDSVSVINPKNIQVKVDRLNAKGEAANLAEFVDDTSVNEVSSEILKDKFNANNINPSKSYFTNYKGSPELKNIDNSQFDELVSDAASANVKPLNQATRYLKRSSPRYEYSKKLNERFLKSKGFSQGDLNSFKASENVEKDFKNMVASKGLDLNKLMSEYKGFMTDTARDLIKHAENSPVVTLKEDS